MPETRNTVAVVGAVVAAVLGAGVAAECRTDPPAPRPAEFGPRIQVSEATILARTPFVSQRPRRPATG